MANARLVKRKELAEKDQAEQTQAAQPTEAPLTVGSVMDWLGSRQNPRRINPREAFAALFAQPQAN